MTCADNYPFVLYLWQTYFLDTVEEVSLPSRIRWVFKNGFEVDADKNDLFAEALNPSVYQIF